MKLLNTTLLGLSLLALTMPGCSESPASDDEGSQYMLQSEPSDVQNVGDVRQTVEDGEEVVMVGRIGGSEKPFIEGVAAFDLVDLSVPYCADDEGCPTPWDYCCNRNQVKKNIAMVKLVGKDGMPVEKDARKLLGVKELSTVVVQGKAKKDDKGNLSILATKVFVK